MCGVPSVECAVSKPQDSKYDYGGMLTGPVWIPKLYNGRNHTFFLFAWEKYQLHLGGVAQSTLPTAAERGGDFSDILGPAATPVPGGTSLPQYQYAVLVNPCTGQPVRYNQIFDPRTTVQISPGVFCRQPFQGNQIPTSLFSAATQKLIAGLPQPNQAPRSTDVFGYQNNFPTRRSLPTPIRRIRFVSTRT